MNLETRKTETEMEGMTLRDRFAMAALPSCMDQIWSRCLRNKTQVENVYEVAAAAAYEQADAMLAERARHSANGAEEQQAAETLYPRSGQTGADGDGWIKHDSDVCPVLWCTAVDVKFRSGSVSLNRRADALVWVRSKEPAGIVAYRVVRR